MGNNLTNKRINRRLRLLLRFMQSHKLLKPFFLNFNEKESVKWRITVLKSKPYVDIRTFLYDIASNQMIYNKRTINFNELFLFSFDWLNTNETAPYWNSISYEWRKFLKKYNE
jgi:hypothetical protein